MDNYGFRGSAGETLRTFLQPKHLLMSTPGVLLLGGLAAGALYLGSVSRLVASAQPLLVVLSFSPVMGFVALRARGADDVSLGNVIAFAVRFCALLIVWGLPLAWLTEEYTLPRLAAGSGPLDPSPGLILLTLTVVVAFAGGCLTLVGATAASSLRQLMSTEPWLWLLLDRRQDLPIYFASILGGVALMIMVATPASLLLAQQAFAWSAHLGIGVSLAGYLAPAAAGVLLAAHLAGQFVAADAVNLDPAQPRADTAPIEHSVPDPERWVVQPSSFDVDSATSKATLPGQQALEFIHSFQALQEKAAEDLEGAIREGEALQKKAPA